MAITIRCVTELNTLLSDAAIGTPFYHDKHILVKTDKTIVDEDGVTRIACVCLGGESVAKYNCGTTMYIPYNYRMDSIDIIITTKRKPL